MSTTSNAFAHRFLFTLVCLIAICASHVHAQLSVARQWNELTLDAIRVDKPRPTVHARNLFHSSAAIYDSWAAYDATALGYFHQEKLSTADIEAAREEAMSYAAYRVLTSRFENSPGATQSLASFDAKMNELGYDRTFTSTSGESPAALGNRIAQKILEFGLTDGSNELANYADTTGYVSVNPPLDVTSFGTTLLDANRWQPLIIEGELQKFLTPHWGDVTGFGLQPAADNGLRMDAGPVPLLGGLGDAEFKQAIHEVIRYGSSFQCTLIHAVDCPTNKMLHNPALFGSPRWRRQVAH